MKDLAFMIIILGVYTLNSCISNNEVDKTSSFSADQVIITGNIENYKGDVKTGRLTHFNAVFRSGNDEAFSIDSLGRFKLSFELIMPTHTNIIFIGRYITYLYLAPGSSYDLTLKESGEFVLEGADAILNDQFIALTFALRDHFRDHDTERMNFVRGDTISYADYCSFLKIGSDQKVDFINSYCDTALIDASIRAMFISDAIYEQAWARILYRMIYSDDGRVIFRNDLPDSFYREILSEFTINNRSAASSRHYMDYVSNLLSTILERSRRDTSRFSAFLRDNSSFNKREVFLITRAYLQDTVISRSDEYRQFIKDNRSELSEVSRGYSIAYLIDTLPSFETGFGRDILLSQCIEKNSFKGSYLPITETVWAQIEQLIYNNEIYDLLRSLDNIQKAKISKSLNEKTSLRDPILAKNSKEFYNKLFDNYKGKYVYVDFWATWCGPCRSELPVSMLLQKEFRDKDIVFLYLCCASDKTSWENYIKSEQLSGEHYFISTDEQNYLSSYFDISGYPTYAIVGPSGELVDNNPPRPSSQNIVKYLDDLVH